MRRKRQRLYVMNYEYLTRTLLVAMVVVAGWLAREKKLALSFSYQLTCRISHIFISLH